MVQVWSALTNNGNGDIGFTTSTVTGIGIGYFNTSNISSALHVNTNLTAAQTAGGAFGLGETFRTHSPYNVDHRWRLYTNNVSGTATEIFRIENPSASGNSINLRGMQNGPMRLSTQDVIRIFLDFGGNPLDGFVGIGNGFVTPSSRLHVHQGNSEDAWFQITGNQTDDEDTDGLRIGVLNSDAPYDAEIKQLEDADLNFYTDALQRAVIKNDGKVGINTDAPGYKLHVMSGASGPDDAFAAEAIGAYTCGSCHNFAGTFLAMEGWGNIGITSSALMTAMGNVPTSNIGGDFYAQDASAGNIAVRGRATIVNGTADASVNHGGQFEASDGLTSTGVSGTANGTNGTNNYGGAFYADGGSDVNTGVYGYSIGGLAADFVGNMQFNGTLSGSSNISTVSDQMFKTNINNISNAMDIISQLQPREFYLDTNNIYGMRFSSKKQYGLIAQELLPVLPELVSEFAKNPIVDASGNETYPGVTYKGVDYTALIGIILKGMQEQQDQIDGLSPRSAAPNSGTIELENLATLQLLQNDPNPFSESTMIRWNIPDEFQNAVVYFYDNNGNQINTYKVNAKGAGELQIFGSRLSSGVYTYTLVVDGKMIDSKKMMKSK